MISEGKGAPPIGDDELESLESIAVEACLTGGGRLSRLFGTDTGETYLSHDVKSGADRASEAAVLDIVREAFPEHEIYAEESGVHGGRSEIEWIVDPLDGTNNFVAGLPTFTTAITVLARGRPVIGVVYVPPLDDLYVAVAGNGIQYEGVPVEASGRPRTPETATVVSVIGHDVKRIPERLERADSLARAVESRCKRRVESWCPTLHWALLSRGTLDGIYCYRPDREEQHLGELFAAEGELLTAERPDVFVAATTPELRNSLLEIVSEDRQ